MRAQVCKDVRCEDWPGAGGWEATTPNFPDLSPAVLKATWKDTQHTSSPGRRGGRGSRLSPSLPYTCSVLYSEAASERVWTLVLETLMWEENGLPVKGRRLSCRRQVGTDLQPK